MCERLFVTRDAAATRALGRALGRVVGPGAVVLLVGELGSGKTTFAQGLAAGMGVLGDVVSPSFALVREYDGPPGSPRFVHMDFYRLQGSSEVRDLGIDDYFGGDDVVAIEWAERGVDALPGDVVVVTLVRAAEERLIALSPGGPSARRMLAALTPPPEVAGR